MINLMIMLASGWLLLIPPIQNNKGTVDDKRPYTEWQQHGAYDTARECERARDSLEASVWNYFTNRKKEAERWVTRIETLPKGSENWDDKDWDMVKQYGEYLESTSQLAALHTANLRARCVPSDVVFSSQPKEKERKRE